MAIYFDWDDEKNRRNIRDHGMDFDTASEVFGDPFRITQEDSVVQGEQRWRTIGVGIGITVLLVVHLEEDFEGDLLVRIISARRATPVERSDYDQNHP
jgi:uncharacterized DUF497 family protein